MSKIIIIGGGGYTLTCIDVIHSLIMFFFAGVRTILQAAILHVQASLEGTRDPPKSASRGVPGALLCHLE